MALVLLLLLASSFTVFGEELESLTLPPTSPPLPHIPAAVPPPHPHTPTPAPLHPPTHSPVHPPHHHRYYHHHPPAPAPVRPPVHPPPTPAPAKPPTPHHYPPSHAPAKPPTYHHYPPTPTPTHAPTKPPTHPHYPPVPAKPPTHPHYPPTPVHPPVHVHPFPRSFVAVQGVVYVKSCKYAGVDTLLGATPVLGAIVKLQCNNTRHKLVQTAKTDKNGYFFLEAPKTVTTFGTHKCNVVLVSAPTGLKPSNLYGGVTGAVLRPEKPYVSQKVPFLLYTVGPLAFEPKCHH